MSRALTLAREALRWLLHAHRWQTVQGALKDGRIEWAVCRCAGCGLERRYRSRSVSPIASPTVVSSPGAAIRVEALELTEAGREMLTVKERL